MVTPKSWLWVDLAKNSHAFTAHTRTTKSL